MTPAQIEQFLNDLATKLTPAAAHVYDLAVRQALITGIYCLIIVISLVIGAAVSARFSVKSFQYSRTRIGTSKGKEYGYERTYSWEDLPSTWAAITCAGISFVCLFLVTFPLQTVLYYLLNPEWQAIQQIIRIIPKP